MVIIRPENIQHFFTIIARENPAAITIVLKNESKSEIEIFNNIDANYNFNYLTFEINKTVLEGESFEYAVYENEPLTADTTLFTVDNTFITADITTFYGNNLIFRGKAFATNQTDLQNYKIRN
jgi:hypothetical protein